MRRYKSVLNTDRFDKRRFKEIYEMSERMQEINKQGQELFPSFHSLLGDLWAAHYKVRPEIIEDEIQNDLLINRSIIGKVLGDQNYQVYHETTKLDDLMSAIGSVRYGEEVYESIQKEQERNEQFKKKMEQLKELLKKQQELQKDLNKQKKQEKKQENQGRQDGQPDQQQQIQDQLQQDIQKTFQNVADQLSSSPDFGMAISQAAQVSQQEARDTVNGLQSLLGGLKPGDGDAELKRVPLRNQLKLADQLAKTKKMQKVAEMAGRMKVIARQKQKSKHKESTQWSGVTLGDDVGSLLPMELGMFSSPYAKNDFLRRFAEKQTMVYDHQGKESLGKGPIILCLDQSGSMDGEKDEQAKAFTLAMLSIAKKQKRDFAYIPFNTRAAKHVYQKGKIKTQEMVDLIMSEPGGGTRFDKAMDLSLEVINRSYFKNADIVFVTDGEDTLSDSYIESFRQKKKEKEFSVISILVGTDNTTLETFSDKVISIQDFLDEKAYEAFEI